MMTSIQPLDEKPFVVSLHHAHPGTVLPIFGASLTIVDTIFFCLSRLQHGVHISTRTSFSHHRTLRSSGQARCFPRCRRSKLHRLPPDILSGCLHQRHGRPRAPVIPLRLLRQKFPHQPRTLHYFSSKMPHSISNPHSIHFQIQRAYPLPSSHNQPLALSCPFPRSLIPQNRSTL